MPPSAISVVRNRASTGPRPAHVAASRGSSSCPLLPLPVRSAAHVRSTAHQRHQPQERHLRPRPQLHRRIQLGHLPVVDQHDVAATLERLNRLLVLRLPVQRAARLRAIPVQRPLRLRRLYEPLKQLRPPRVVLSHFLIHTPPDDLTQRHRLVQHVTHVQAPAPPPARRGLVENGDGVHATLLFTTTPLSHASPTAHRNRMRRVPAAPLMPATSIDSSASPERPSHATLLSSRAP